MFKECSSCDSKWSDRDDFLADPELALVGYQANFGELMAGLFLFNHNKPECGTSLGLPVEQFADLHEGPVFEKRPDEFPKDCPRYCYDPRSLDVCYAECECSFVRDVLQKLKNWPKTAGRE